MLRYKTKLELV